MSRNPATAFQSVAGNYALRSSLRFLTASPINLEIADYRIDPHPVILKLVKCQVTDIRLDIFCGFCNIVEVEHSWDLGIDNVLKDGIADEQFEGCIRHEINFSPKKVFEIEFCHHEIIKGLLAILERNKDIHIAVRPLLSACE